MKELATHAHDETEAQPWAPWLIREAETQSMMMQAAGPSSQGLDEKGALKPSDQDPCLAMDDLTHHPDPGRPPRGSPVEMDLDVHPGSCEKRSGGGWTHIASPHSPSYRDTRASLPGSFKKQTPRSLMLKFGLCSCLCWNVVKAKHCSMAEK